MTAIPKNIRALQEDGVLEITWPDETVHEMPYKYLREECPCAGCVNEFTGERILDVDSIPPDIKPTQLSFTGNYALKIAWSDGHDTGLYTWDRLAELCRSDRVTARPAEGT